MPKWDGGLGSPNVFAPASVADTDLKIAWLMEFFGTQRSKHWFDDLTFRGLMRLRGMESCAPEALAEAFYGRMKAYEDGFNTGDARQLDKPLARNLLGEDAKPGDAEALSDYAIAAQAKLAQQAGEELMFSALPEFPAAPVRAGA